MRFRDLKTTAELVSIYRFKNAECCRKWLVRHQVPYLRRGRVILVDTRDMDRVCAATKERPMKRLLIASLVVLACGLSACSGQPSLTAPSTVVEPAAAQHEDCGQICGDYQQETPW